ncbi:hypothetical protein CCACVL1_14684 [Corchorus capsularis]|uniref:Uncharacterized protein n=1 Tax=Corchorus capsularis TaxID=210143 RepID=A0A1R3I633_COCAP|nr:hypothetical protein CCACVL1_14684 [Corchorus capsularis]
MANTSYTTLPAALGVCVAGRQSETEKDVKVERDVREEMSVLFLLKYQFL